MDIKMGKISLLIMCLFMIMVSIGCKEKAQGPSTPQVKTKKVRHKEMKTEKNKVTGAENKPEETPYTYNPEGRRDPFRSPLLGLQAKKKKVTGLTPLQKRSLSELRVIGIIWSGHEYMAMIETPDGKGYVVKKGTLVGPDGGVVTKITKDAIIIEEKFVNLYGKQEIRKTELRLHPKEVDG